MIDLGHRATCTVCYVNLGFCAHRLYIYAKNEFGRRVHIFNDMGAMSSSAYNRRMLHVFCLKGQFPEMLMRLRKKQAREGLTELELDNDASVRSHAQINTIHNRARDWEHDWANQPCAPRRHRPRSLNTTAHTGGDEDDGGHLWARIWVCVCAQLCSVTCLLGLQNRPRPTATRVVFKTVLVEFSLPWEEPDEVEVAH